MDALRWTRIRDLYHAAYDRAPEQRRALLDARCGQDSSLRDEVEALLAREAGLGHFLEPPSSFAGAASLGDGPHASLVGRRVGGYSIRGVLGHGGSGVVYEAEQVSPQRTVALKVLRLLTLQDEWATRLFAREGQALARLTHPGIAAIYEAGSSAECGPYFAMEHVEGAPLTAFAKQRGLSTRARLSLFAQVCDAVHYAHQRGVIHRDLKPSNILATPTGTPKVLDFGLARIIDAEAADRTRATAAGVVLGTLPYMSPEQARGQVERIDTQTDIYSLGVILYELLTDQPPFDTRGKPLPEAARVICEQAPRRPGQVRRRLRGDLETIILKAMDKEPARRYSSAAALAQDVHRYLNDEPVLARPATATYQLRKLIARHKLPAVLIAILFLVCAISAAGMGGLALRFAEQRDLARAAQDLESEARAVAEEFATVLSDLFGRADPEASDFHEPSLRQVLDEGYKHLEDIYHPVVRARIMTVMGEVYRKLGQQERSRELLETAIALLRDAHGDHRPEIADALLKLVFAVDRPSAAAAASEALALRRGYYGDEHPLVAEAWNRRGEAHFYAGEYADALADFQRALAIWSAPGAAALPDLASALANSGASLKHLGRLEEAEAVLRRAVELREELADEALTLQTIANLAQLIWQRDREEAVPYFASLVDRARAHFRENHPRLAWHIRNYGYVVGDTRGLDQAESFFREAVEIYRSAYGAEHPETAQSLEMLGQALARQAKYVEAVDALGEAVASWCALRGPDHARTKAAEATLTRMQARVSNAGPPEPAE